MFQPRSSKLQGILHFSFLQVQVIVIVVLSGLNELASPLQCPAIFQHHMVQACSSFILEFLILSLY